jgi:phosphoribosyl 1,2-cyclic phosphate phosphodiesterase
VKVTILGSGSAYGVPYAGGGWGACDPKNPKNRRTSPSILIEDKGSRLLIDMSPDFRQHAEKHNIRLLDGVLFTHAHADHITGMFHLPIFMAHYQDRNLPLYADRFTRIGIEKVWWYMFDEKISPEYSGPGRPYWHEVIAPFPLQIGNIKVTPFIQTHGRIHSLGVRVGNFVYSTDVSAFPEESHKFLKDIDVWVVDCNCVAATDNSHGNLEKSLGWIEQFKPKKAYLSHLDYTVDYDTISARLPKNVELAYDDLEIVLP